MQRFISIILIFTLLVACGPTSQNGPVASESTALFTSSPYPTETKAAISESTTVASPEAAFSYLTSLELKQTDSLTLPNYNGATLPAGSEILRDVSVTPATPEVSMTDELQSKLAFRAVLRMIYPDLPDNDQSLADLTAKIESGDCADLIRTAKLFTTNAEGRQTVSFMPYCAGFEVPEGVVAIRGVNIVLVKAHDYDGSSASATVRPEFPWFHVISPIGHGAGLMIDTETGTILIFVDQGGQINQNSDSRQFIAGAVEIAVDWIGKEVEGLGDRFKLSGGTKHFNKGRLWIGEIEVH